MNLDEAMATDRVIEVLPDGSFQEPPGCVWIPELNDDELSDSSWSLFSAGYTGQYGYNGPIMHNSERIGGLLERAILAQSGYYVVLESYYTNDLCPACGSEIDYCPGHGTIGDPEGAIILARHDNDDHDACDMHAECVNGPIAEGWAVAYRPVR